MNDVSTGTQRFRCFTAAGPARVWAALTGARQTSRFLYGLATHSSWLEDAPIRFKTAQSQTAGHSSLTGRVLYAQPLCRLSYLLQSGPEDPPVYLTWQVRPCPGGSVIGLQIDEVEFADNDEDAENTWLPVLAALQALLGRGDSETELPEDRAPRDLMVSPAGADNEAEAMTGPMGIRVYEGDQKADEATWR
jgi:uncharacterized protein YndB with AHSA1/START domain